MSLSTVSNPDLVPTGWKKKPKNKKKEVAKMPAPNPKKGEKQQDFVSRCIAFYVEEGKEPDQAAAMAYSMWRDAKGIKKFAIEKSIPWDISVGDLMQKVSDAWSVIWPSDYNAGNYGGIREVYLDGTCIVSKSEKGQPTKYIRYDFSFNADDEVELSNPQEVEEQKEWVEKSWEEELEKAQWTAKYIGDLPDSSFAYVESGGEKDEDGKTVPRSLRHFPYKDAGGSVDLPHLRNALARAPQSPFGDKAMSKLKAAAKAEKIGEFAKGDEGPDDIRIESQLIKTDEEQGLIYGVILEPEEIDSQGDIISEGEITKAAHDFMVGYREQQTKVSEMHKREARKVNLVESYVAPTDFKMGDKKVKKGSWIGVSKVLDHKTNPLWNKVKKGEYTGYSIKGKGKRTPVE